MFYSKQNLYLLTYHQKKNAMKKNKNITKKEVGNNSNLLHEMRFC